MVGKIDLQRLWSKIDLFRWILSSPLFSNPCLSGWIILESIEDLLYPSSSKKIAASLCNILLRYVCIKKKTNVIGLRFNFSRISTYTFSELDPERERKLWPDLGHEEKRPDIM